MPSGHRPGEMSSPQWLQIFLARREAGKQPIQISIGSLPNITWSELVVKVVAAHESIPRQSEIVIAAAVLEHPAHVTPAFSRL